MDSKKTAIILVLVVVVVILFAVLASGFLSQSQQTLQVDDLNIMQDEFGIYKLQGHITPEKDYAYMEARIVFYDEHGTIIGKAPCAWNMRDLEKGSEISVGNGLGAVVDGTPSYAVVSFYDNVGSNDALANFTVHFDGTNNKTNDTGSGSSSSVTVNNNNADNGDNRKYTQEDMDRARQESYWNGYDDSSSDSGRYYADDSSSQSSQGSSYDSGSSDSSNVETTTDSGGN